MILILLGNGVVAGVVLNKSKAQNAGWIVITAAWAFAVLAGMLTAKAVGAPGFINPVGPLAMVILGKLEVASQSVPMQANPATAHLFIVNPLSGQALMRLFSTHPPIEERIARLRAMRI